MPEATVRRLTPLLRRAEEPARAARRSGARVVAKAGRARLGEKLDEEREGEPSVACCY